MSSAVSTAVAGATRRRVRQLRRLLASGPEGQAQAAELLADLDDPAAHDAILGAIESTDRGPALARLTRRDAIPAALHLLAAAGPAGGPMRDRVRSLHLEGRVDRRPTLPTRLLGSFPALTHLRLELAQLDARGAPPTLPALRDVVLSTARGAADLRWLSRATELESLDIRVLPPSLEGIEGLPIRRLELIYFEAPTALEPVTRLPALRELLLRGTRGNTDLSAIGALEGLELLAVSRAPAFDPAAHLGDHPRLHTLRLSRLVRPRSLDFLERLPALEDLEIALGDVRDPAPLYRAPRLRRLRLHGRGSLDPERLRERGVELR